jgi:hypothetical protein
VIQRLNINKRGIRPLVGQGREEISVRDDHFTRSEEVTNSAGRVCKVFIPVRGKQKRQCPRGNLVGTVQQGADQFSRRQTGRFARPVSFYGAPGCIFVQVVAQSTGLGGRSRSVQSFKHDEPGKYRILPRQRQHPESLSHSVIRYLTTERNHARR